MEVAVPFNNTMSFDIDILHELLEEEETITTITDDDDKPSSHHHHHHQPSRAYVRESRAMAATPADAKELPGAYAFVMDMPGLKADQVKVGVEDAGNSRKRTLVVSGERKREKERDQGVKYVRMERRLGKYLKKFDLPENADAEKVAAVYQDGVLTVTVEKKTAEVMKPRSVEVQGA